MDVYAMDRKQGLKECLSPSITDEVGIGEVDDNVSRPLTYFSYTMHLEHSHACMQVCGHPGCLWISAARLTGLLGNSLAQSTKQGLLTEVL